MYYKKRSPKVGSQNSKSVSGLDLVVLLGNVYLGARDPKVGFEDAEMTLNEMIAALNRYQAIPRSVFESALWSCNLLNENEAFWDPKGRTFKQFLEHVLMGEKFDLDYNLLEKTPG